MKRIVRNQPWVMAALIAAAVALPRPDVEATDLGRGNKGEEQPKAADATKGGGKRKIADAIKLDTGGLLKGLKGGGGRGKVKELVDVASKSAKEKNKDIRELMGQVKDQDEVADGLCEEVKSNSKADHGRTVVALGLLGEMRNKKGVQCMSSFVDQDLPTKGTVVDGDILERVVLEQQMMKAVDGLAFSDEAGAQEKVLKVAGGHASKAVRAEAIGAYLEAQGNTDAAKKELAGKIKEEDKIFLDRLVMMENEKPEDFNKRLEAFLAAHPELKPKDPEKAKVQADSAEAPVNPPKLD